MTMANGNIYAWTRGSTAFTRGIYKVPTVPNSLNHLILESLWTDSTVSTEQYDFQGLTYNIGNGLFYGVNSSANHAVGIYSIDAFGTGAVSLIANSPVGHAQIDQQAISGQRGGDSEESRGRHMRAHRVARAAAQEHQGAPHRLVVVDDVKNYVIAHSRTPRHSST